MQIQLCVSPNLCIALEVRRVRRIQLGDLTVDIRSNETDFPGMRYFPAVLAVPDPNDCSADYVLNLCNLGVDEPWPVRSLLQYRDRSYRAGRFEAGYYITDHFGTPACLMSRGNQVWVFADSFEPILWPYLVKWLLTVHSIDEATLHLKGSCISIGGAATLLVARGGGGKTVLLTRLCGRGAQFLSNTHCLIDGGGRVTGVKTAMRVRKDELFGPLIEARGLTAGFKRNEFLADPLEDFGWAALGSAQLQNICLVDYRPATVRIIDEMSRSALYDYMEQFALAMNVYGLKEDLLEHLGGDIGRFSAQLQLMRRQLRELIDRCNCYHVQADAMDESSLSRIHATLGGPDSGVGEAASIRA